MCRHPIFRCSDFFPSFFSPFISVDAQNVVVITNSSNYSLLIKRIHFQRDARKYRLEKYKWNWKSKRARAGMKTASKNIPLLNETHTQIKLQMRNATERMLKNRIKKLTETYREIERERNWKRYGWIWLVVCMTYVERDAFAFVLMQRISFACSDLITLPPHGDYKSLTSIMIIIFSVALEWRALHLIAYSISLSCCWLE